MNIIEIILIGIALSMDAFAVTISNSFVYQHESRARMMLMPVAFGAFQWLMPIAGFFAGTIAAGFIESYAGIVAFVILAFIGGNMVREGVSSLRGGGQAEEGDAGPEQRRLTVGSVLVQAVATSIDAFAVGVSLLASGANILLASPVIGVTTFLCCVVALLAGRRFGELLGDKAEVVGGVVLVAIGVKTLLF